ncbi:MAG: DMT family transporter [Micrococcales bacterium]
MTKTSTARFGAGDFMLILVAAFWGATYLAVKVLGNAGSIPGMMAIRFVLAAAALWIYWAIRRQRITKLELTFGAIFGVSQTVVLNLEALSVHYTSATNGGLIIALAIITVPILESSWNKNWLPPRFFVATVLAVIGLALLITGNGLVQPNIGDLFMLIAVLIRTVHFVVLGQVSNGRSLSPVNLTTIMVSTSALIMTVFGFGEIASTARGYSPLDWALMLFLSVLCTSFAFIGMNWAVKHTSASRTSLLLGTEPVWATFLATLVGGEAIGILGIIGAAMIVGATYWGQAIEARHRLG